MTRLEWFAFSGAADGMVLDAALKVTLLLAAGLFAVRWARRASASWRLSVLLIVLIGAVAVPILSVLLPSVVVPILPAPPTRATTATAPLTALPARPADAPPRVSKVTPPRAGTSSPAVSTSAAATDRDHSRTASPTLAPVFLASWALGLLWSLIRQRNAHRRVRALERSARVEIEPALIATLELTAARVGVRRSVQLLTARERIGPMTWGHREPVILLPEDHREWSCERRAIVLQHELFHIKRSDWLVRVVARTAAAIYWFHPLAWMVLERIVEEQEHACDREVLALGTRATRYAQHLLALARRSTDSELPNIPLPALPMARRRLLEVRLMSILDQKPRSRTLSVALAIPALCFFALLVPALAAVEPWAQEPQEPKTPAEARAQLLEVVRDIERIEAQIEPHEAQLRALEAELRPTELHLESIEDALAPHREQLEAVEAELEPFEAELRAVEARLEPHEDALAEAERALRPFEALFEAIEAELAPFEKELDALELDLAPFEARINEIEARLDNIDFEGDDAQRDQFEQQLEAVHREMQPVLAQMEEVHEQMRPVQERLESIHLEMEPAHAELEEVHLRLEPVLKEMEKIHIEMKPVFRRMESLHLEVEPVIARVENAHLDMQPVLERIEAVQREMHEPLEEIERLHGKVESSSSVLVDDVLRRELATLQLDERAIATVRGSILEVAGLNLRNRRLQLVGDFEELRERIELALEGLGVDDPGRDALSQQAARALLALEVDLE